MVMLIFLKKFFRDLSESKIQFISSLMVVIVGVMFYTGLNSSISNLSGAGNRYFKDYRLADLWSSVYRAPESVIKKVEQIPGVEMATGRIIQDVRVTIDGREAIVRLISLPDEKSTIVNDIQLKGGSYFSNANGNEVIASASFFKANKLSIGQVIEPVINGDKVKLKVVGTADSPEYVYEIKDGSEAVPNPQKFGILYVKRSFLQNILDFKGSVNDISVLLDNGSNAAKIKDALKKILDKYGLINTLERKNQLSYNYFDAFLIAIKALAAVFPILFFIAAALIIYIAMTRMIENQRTQMGVLKALGYSNFDIMLHYQTYPLLIGVLGSIIGSLAGVFIIGKGLTGIFLAFFTLTIEKVSIDTMLVIPASLLALFFCVLAGYNACKKELRLVPAESMRQKPPTSGKKIFLENVSFFWKKINFSWKIIFKNLFRYKRRSAMASLGIVFSMALLLVGLGLKNSSDETEKVNFTKIQKYNLKINFSRILDNDELNYIRGISHVVLVEPLLETGVEISNGWMKKNIGLIALKQNSTLYGVIDNNGNPLPLPDRGILIPERLMNTLGIVNGEKAYLRFYYPGENEEKDKKEAEVKGAILQYTGLSAISSIDYFNYLLKEGLAVNAAYIKLDNPIYQNEVIQKLKDILTVTTIQSKSDVQENTKKSLKSMNSIFLVMILGSGILAFAVIYNIANINIMERRREIATLSVLGFTSRELKSVVFNENFFICGFGSIVGIPLGILLLGYILKVSNTDTMEMPLVFNASSYIIAIFLMAAFTVAANLLLTKKILSINMVESLKSAE